MGLAISLTVLSLCLVGLAFLKLDGRENVNQLGEHIKRLVWRLATRTPVPKVKKGK